MLILRFKNILKLGNREILDFGLFLRTNSANIINQIPAFYGYVIEPQDNNQISVWIAGENGNIDSDMIQIIIKHSDDLFFADCRETSGP